VAARWPPKGFGTSSASSSNTNHLVANLLIFHNVVTMSKALERLVAEGYALDHVLSRIATHPINHIEELLPWNVAANLSPAAQAA